MAKPNGAGGVAAATGLIGGAGGITQIISPAGRLPLNVLSVKRGTIDESACTEAEHGYYYFVGGDFG